MSFGRLKSSVQRCGAVNIQLVHHQYDLLTMPVMMIYQFIGDHLQCPVIPSFRHLGTGDGNDVSFRSSVHFAVIVLMFFPSKSCCLPSFTETLGKSDRWYTESCTIGFLNGGIRPLPVFGDFVQFQQDLCMADAVSLCFAFGNEFFKGCTFFGG